MTSTPLSPEEFVERLKSISGESGVPFGRLALLDNSIDEHKAAARHFKGYWALSDAFKCFFLETTELINSFCRPRITVPLSADYGLLVPRVVHNFRALCGAEQLATLGYPMEAWTVLRNVFDSLVLTSAALQKFTNFYSIEGVVPNQTLDMKRAKELRKTTEFAVRKKMTGVGSGLSSAAISDLAKVDTLFDHEVHGAQISLADATPWLKGLGALRVVPLFNERRMAAFMNRASEFQWMLHRLLPMLQPPGVQLPSLWEGKWRVIDESFEAMVKALSQGNAKTIGESMVEFVKAKFPFDERTVFPL